MLVKYSCPICDLMHKLETGGAEADEVFKKVIEHAHVRFGNSVLKADWGRGYKSAKGARSRGPVYFRTRDVKKAVKLLKQKTGEPVNRIPGLECASTKMLGIVHVTHTDGVVSKIVSESGNSEILGPGAGDFEGHKIGVEAIDGSLHSIFATKDIPRIPHLGKLSEADFNQPCAAMKALLAVASDRAIARGGGSNFKYLKSGEKIESINLSETVYKPFTEKMLFGFRQYTRIIDTAADVPEPTVVEDLVIEKDEELEETDHYMAKPCGRCQLKVPAIICPIENKSTKKVFDEASHFMEGTTRG